MMNWILILIATTGAGSPATVSTVEFEDKKSCEIAGGKLDLTKVPAPPLKYPRAYNPETGEWRELDGTEWKPIPAPLHAVQAPGHLGITWVCTARKMGVQ